MKAQCVRDSETVLMKDVERLNTRRGRGEAYHQFQDSWERIFHVEGEWEDRRGTLGKEDFVKGRKAALLPLFEDMKSWLEEVVRQAEESGAEIERRTSVAISYFLDRYDELTRFLDHYCANSSNNRRSNSSASGSSTTTTSFSASPRPVLTSLHSSSL